MVIEGLLMFDFRGLVLRIMSIVMILVMFVIGSGVVDFDCVSMLLNFMVLIVLFL